ncbi:Fc.00g094350.m01.CDS01 [Cosmosporella sp. VM-42]
MHPALKVAFEVSYSSKYPDHKDLITIRFDEFFWDTIREETFAQLSFEIDREIAALVTAEDFETHWGAFEKNSQALKGVAIHQGDDAVDEESSRQETDMFDSRSFKLGFQAAPRLDVLKCMRNGKKFWQLSYRNRGARGRFATLGFSNASEERINLVECSIRFAPQIH